MLNKTKLRLIKPALIAIGVVFIASYANATVSFTINQGGLRNIIGGDPTNGMFWGLLFDTDGDGFDLGSYDGFDVTSNYVELTVGGVASGDVYVFSGDENSVTPPTTLGGAPLPVGPGTVTTISQVKYDGPTKAPSLGSAVGNSFGVIWFPENTSVVGAAYGFANNSDFIIPSDSFAFSTFEAIAPLDPIYTIVPEPSLYATVLGIIAWVCIFRRNRHGSKKGSVQFFMFL